MKKIELLDVVALTDDIPEHKLRRGQVGTVVEVFNDGQAFEVEFADLTGRTYEMLAVEPSKLMVLQYEPDAMIAA